MEMKETKRWATVDMLRPKDSGEPAVLHLQVSERRVRTVFWFLRAPEGG